ncbi:ABC transporter permease [Thioclava kandeliae]|uniref:ABC transporter permease n=1 Tax=Thioclava kandeliae TaxID=3070818 RepID=A0ABV1SMH8_9RHOB
MSMALDDDTTEKVETDDNARKLASDERRESLRHFAFAFPVFLIIVCLVFGPVGWLFGLSFVQDGQFSLVHYERLLSGAYVAIFTQTFQVSLTVTALAILLGYPLAYLMSQSSQKLANIILLSVMVPFWTSLLVRTYAWMILLQRRGIVNDTLISLGIIDTPLRLVNNMTGTIIGMLHVMLPFMILPLYASLKQVDTTYLRAASSLGASPVRAYWSVFFPLSLPGVFAGAILVFVLSLGFYVTPALLGGGRVIMVSMKIQQNAAMYFDWGAASALGVVLLAITVLLFAVMNRFVRIERMFGGS